MIVKGRFLRTASAALACILPACAGGPRALAPTAEVGYAAEAAPVEGVSLDDLRGDFLRHVLRATVVFRGGKEGTAEPGYAVAGALTLFDPSLLEKAIALLSHPEFDYRIDYTDRPVPLPDNLFAPSAIFPEVQGFASQIKKTDGSTIPLRPRGAKLTADERAQLAKTLEEARGSVRISGLLKVGWGWDVSEETFYRRLPGYDVDEYVFYLLNSSGERYDPVRVYDVPDAAITTHVVPAPAGGSGPGRVLRVHYAPVAFHFPGKAARDGVSWIRFCAERRKNKPIDLDAYAAVGAEPVFPFHYVSAAWLLRHYR